MGKAVGEPNPARITIKTLDGIATPVLEGTDTSVAHVVGVCHGQPVDEALGALNLKGLDRSSLDPVLVYCARRDCEKDGATCRGCRLRLRLDGISTLDQFVAKHREITVGDGDVVIRGAGEGSCHVGSLDELAKSWDGEEYWYWARRVLRKLRHGVRRAEVQGKPFANDGETPAVILVKPQLADNIGMCARAMGNFGLDTLRLVDPRDGWPNERARVAACGANYIIDGVSAHETTEDAMGDLNWVCATTARQRDLRKPVMTPEAAIAEMARRIRDGQKCGILFGPEASGMASADLETADALVMIPVNNAFASLNLAQAVLIMGYSWMLTRDDKSLGRVTQNEQRKEPGLDLGADRPATKEELVGFFEHLEAELLERGFFTPLERRPAVVQNLRTLFTRTGATAQEVRSLRGIVATLTRATRPRPKSQ